MTIGSRYEALLPIGSGGMATVFIGRARDPSGYARFVALKRAHPHVRLDSALMEGMKREARIASRLSHTNVVRVLDVEEDQGDLVLVLDYVEGCTLRTLLLKVAERLGQEHPRETLRIILDAAHGLHAAHQATDESGRLLGLVHRDVSPSNVLVGADGISRIADFGIAKAVFEGSSSERTETGVLKGKLSYMAPEYVMHQRATPASDLFSLAVMTWESLANARLFKGATDIDTLQNVASARFRPLGAERPQLAPLDVVLKRALAKAPSDRHASVEQFAMELEAVARTHDLVATHVEVSKLVERAIEDELAERRLALGSEDAATVVAPLLVSGNGPERERALDVTVDAGVETLLAMSPRPAAGRPALDAQSSQQIASDARRSQHVAVARPERESVIAPLGGSTVVLDSPRTSRGLLAAERQAFTSEPPGRAAMPASLGAMLTTQPVRTSQPPAPSSQPPARASVAPVHPRRGERTVRRPQRGREVLTLLIAFGFLGLALAAMAYRLRHTTLLDEPRPSTTRAEADASVTSAADSGATIVNEAASASAPPSAAPSASPSASTSPSASGSSAKRPKPPTKHR